LLRAIAVDVASVILTHIFLSVFFHFFVLLPPPSSSSTSFAHTLKQDVYVPRGVSVQSLDPTKQWTFKPKNFREGQSIGPGDIFGTVFENEIMREHSILCPPNVSGTVVKVYGNGTDGNEEFNVNETVSFDPFFFLNCTLCFLFFPTLFVLKLVNLVCFFVLWSTPFIIQGLSSQTLPAPPPLTHVLLYFTTPNRYWKSATT